MDGQRKSMQPMAERLGVDHQQLQQFATPSTWDTTGVRRRTAALLTGLIAPDVWVVDDTGFAKDGKASACVARQCWRTGTRTTPDNPTAAMTGHFLALRVRPAGRHVARDENGLLPQRWLLVGWPPTPPNPATAGCPTCPPTPP